MTTPSARTSYADGSANTVRPTARTYPDGRVVTYDYGAAGGIDDAVSRVASLVDDDDTHLADYQRLGLAAVVQQDSPEADLRSTLMSLDGTNDPDTGDIYAGLDRFGRVKDVRWPPRAGCAVERRETLLVRRIGGRACPAVAGTNRPRRYDGLHRLQTSERGTLNGAHTAIADPQFGQCWNLDALGNWQGFRQANVASPWDLVQARLANAVNEITGITNSVGPAWAQPAYDAAGNMTTIPQPHDPTEEYTATYDAWNRLAKLVDPATGQTVQENQYDARGFRIVRKSYTAGVLTETRHYYDTDGWRCVEERLGTTPDSAAADRQYVWGVRYIDDLVLRDRGSERLYALQDGNWNVTAVVDAAGAVQERYEYDPYGVTTFLSPAFAVRSSSSYGWETTYAGYRMDHQSELYLARHRLLHPQAGWLQRDPVDYVETVSLYAYVSCSPLTDVDAYGLVGPALHHGHPLHLGGSMAQPVWDFTCRDVGERAHQAAHNYLDRHGFGFGDEGREARAIARELTSRRGLSADRLRPSRR